MTLANKKEYRELMLMALSIGRDLATVDEEIRQLKKTAPISDSGSVPIEALDIALMYDAKRRQRVELAKQCCHLYQEALNILIDQNQEITKDDDYKSTINNLLAVTKRIVKVRDIIDGANSYFRSALKFAG